jgi:hypothetical protein
MNFLRGRSPRTEQKRSSKRDQSGSALVTSLVAVSVLTAISAYILNGTNTGNQDLDTILLYDAIKIIKTNILTIMGEWDSDQATILPYASATGLMKCMNSTLGIQCATGTTGGPPFVLQYVPDPGPGASIYYDGAATSGFMLDGTVCTAAIPFSGAGSINTMDGCVLHVDLSWTLNCIGGAPSCINANVQISLTGTFTTGVKGITLNPAITDGVITM